MSQYFSPLRYPGGKAKLANYFKLLFKQNNLYNIPYVEIFAGGMGIGLDLLFSGFASNIVINDFSKSIYAFWHTVLNNTDALCEKISNTNVTIDEWKVQKDIQIREDEVSLFELGYSTFFLNRTNRSGIINGGVIGGLKQNGKYRINERFNMLDLIKRIYRIAEYKDKITLSCTDASQYLSDNINEISQNSFLYLDPPYYIKGKGLYQDYYHHDDHKLISELINNVKLNWVVTYDNVDPILQLYNNYRKIIYGINYSAATHYKGAEVMFFSEDLIIPKIDSPVRCKYII